MQKIDAEAFAGIAAKHIFVPDSVNEIDTSAFSQGVTIHANQDSYAAFWAVENGYNVVFVGE